jgi:hypothetical protein
MLLGIVLAVGLLSIRPDVAGVKPEAHKSFVVVAECCSEDKRVSRSRSDMVGIRRSHQPQDPTHAPLVDDEWF